MARWIKFNLVGALGAVVQIAVVWGAVHLFAVHYLAATVLAIEVTIVHNFFWHTLWTFSDRDQLIQSGRQNDNLKRNMRSFLKFQLTAGAISIPGNAAIMVFSVGYLRMNVIVANCLAIGICSTANFVAADRFSFRHSDPRKILSCSRS